MFASTRIFNLGRSVLPYAQWVIMAIQIGYVGYNLSKNLYELYAAQVERDSRNNTTRPFAGTMEMVVKAKRKHDKYNMTCNTNTDGGNSNSDNVTNDGIQSNGQISHQDPEAHCSYTITSTKEIDNELENKENSGELADTLLSSRDASSSRWKQDENEVTVVYDSQLCGPSNQHDQSIMTPEGCARDEILSFGSTSIESTDSNNGIIKDMYSECFICARALYDSSDRPVATLPFCMHPFHKSCLDGVLSWHSRCPVCDFHIFSPI